MAVQLYLLSDSNRQRLHRLHVFRDRTSPLDTLDDADLIARYRLPRHCITELCDLLNDDLERPTQRTHYMAVATQVLTALGFYATGAFQKDAGDLHGISQASVSCCVSTVSALLRTVPNTFSNEDSVQVLQTIYAGAVESLWPFQETARNEFNQKVAGASARTETTNNTSDSISSMGLD